MTDATTVLIQHPAKEHGNPWGCPRAGTIQPEEVGRQEQEQSSFPRELSAVICEPHYAIFEDKSSAKPQSSFQFTRHGLSLDFLHHLKDPLKQCGKSLQKCLL